MNLTNDEKAVVKILIEKELEHITKDGNQLVIVNAPFITKVIGDDPDLPFLKSLKLYQKFLQNMHQKL